ncbi:16154_t:CDS:2, partial [Acaulospora morrowiae]
MGCTSSKDQDSNSRSIKDALVSVEKSEYREGDVITFTIPFIKNSKRPYLLTNISDNGLYEFAIITTKGKQDEYQYGVKLKKKSFINYNTKVYIDDLTLRNLTKNKLRDDQLKRRDFEKFKEKQISFFANTEQYV